ncbi:hypothetical protein MBRA_19340 [Mycobacterium branderi]|nr:hypothetical protein MBRA_19340 [Mycobacterium branderi]
MAAAMTVAVAPGAYADDLWGACAAPANPNTSSYVMCTTGNSTQADAENHALGLCNYLKNRQCSVVVSFTDCGAVAGNGNQWAGGTGPSVEAAQQAAMGQLSGGTIVKSGCVAQG